jgi:NADH-quinone oxidoreductase subunit L
MSSLLGLIPFVLLGGAGFLGAVAALSTRKARVSEKFIGLVGVLGPAVSFVFALVLFLGIDSSEGKVESTLWSWIKAGSVSIDLVFRADHLTCVMLLVITGIGTLIHLYSTGYLHGDPGLARYFACLNLFLFFMTVLVLAGDLVVMFVGWEGVGLCSYLLIGFWWTDAEKAQAGLKAFVVNRIGDAGFLLGMFLLWQMAGTLDLARIHEKVQDGAFAAALTSPMGWLGASAATIIALLLFLGATGKSAQIPLYVWLPDAMAGPTPVSALIHAATMVTAGVYMIARLNGLYALSPTAQAVIVVVATATCLLAAGIALVQNDIKKVLAYSTVSQLGYMFIGVGSGAITAGVFHLVTHAFFKACLFLGAGSIIHALHHEQDLRNMGGLRRPMPVTFRTMLVAALAMAGIPPLAGFFSKDEILWRAWQFGGVGRIAWAVGSVAALGTAFYAFRLIFLAFGGSYRGSRDDGHHHGGVSAIHESPRVMTIPLIVLATGAALVGLLGVPHVLGGHDRFGHYLEPVLAKVPAGHGAEASGSAVMSVESALMVLAIAIAVLGVIIAHRFYVANPSLPGVVAGRFPVLYRRLVALLGIDAFYEKRIVAPIRDLADRALSQRVDRRLIDGFVNGCAGVARRMARAVSLVQDGSIQNYLTWMVLGTLLLLLTLLT